MNKHIASMVKIQDQKQRTLILPNGDISKA